MRALAAVMVLCTCAAARADEPLPEGPLDLTGPRALAMGGALRSLGTTNDATYLNPAGIAQVQRYTGSMQGLHDFKGSLDSFGGGVSDSTAGPVAAALQADRVIVGPDGSRQTFNVFHLALATQLSDFIVLGATGKWIHSSDATGSHNRVTPDVGLLFKADIVNLALVGYNLIDIHSAEAPRQYAGAVSLALPHDLKLAADVVLDTQTHPDVSLAYHAGAEWEVVPILALRGGFVEDRIRAQRTVSGGVGVLVPPGFGVDVAYAHELLGSTPARIVQLGLNFAF